MSVKLAAHVFSHLVASTIQTCVISPAYLKSSTALDTRYFKNFIDKFFDCLNSRNLFSKNPYNFTLTDSGVVKSFLSQATNYLNNIFKVNSKGKANRTSCFNGYTQIINGILNFFDNKSKNNNILLLFTKKLNQDVFNLSVKGGYN